MTYVDFTMFELCEFMEFISEGQLYQNFPSLKAYADRVKALPKLAEFYADDEKCMKAPFNNKIAKLSKNLNRRMNERFDYLLEFT